MSKKILVLSGSHRKGGNSDTLCDEFIKGAQESGHQVEKIFINDKKNQLLHWLRCLQQYPQMHLA